MYFHESQEIPHPVWWNIGEVYHLFYSAESIEKHLLIFSLADGTNCAITMQEFKHHIVHKHLRGVRGMRYGDLCSYAKGNVIIRVFCEGSDLFLELDRTLYRRIVSRGKKYYRLTDHNVDIVLAKCKEEHSELFVWSSWWWTKKDYTPEQNLAEQYNVYNIFYLGTVRMDEVLYPEDVNFSLMNDNVQSIHDLPKVVRVLRREFVK